jgi:hypothetical protein
LTKIVRQRAQAGQIASTGRQVPLRQIPHSPQEVSFGVLSHLNVRGLQVRQLRQGSTASGTQVPSRQTPQLPQRVPSAFGVQCPRRQVWHDTAASASSTRATKSPAAIVPASPFRRPRLDGAAAIARVHRSNRCPSMRVPPMTKSRLAASLVDQWLHQLAQGGPQKPSAQQIGKLSSQQVKVCWLGSGKGDPTQKN